MGFEIQSVRKPKQANESTPSTQSRNTYTAPYQKKSGLETPRESFIEEPKWAESTEGWGGEEIHTQNTIPKRKGGKHTTACVKEEGAQSRNQSLLVAVTLPHQSEDQSSQ